MILCFDIGNTKTACALYNDDVLYEIFEYPTAETLTTSKLADKIIQKMPQIEGMAFSSVVVQKNEEYINFAGELNIKKIVKITPNCKLNVPLCYDLSKLGSDRIANIEEACAVYGKNAIIVDIGTAITFDVVKDGVFIGGLILPGLNSAFEALNRDADAIEIGGQSLDNIIGNLWGQSPDKNNIIGNNTEDGVKSGIFFGWIAMIEGLFEKIRVLHDRDFTLVLTGGLSQALSSNILTPHIVNKMLTLNGIYRIYLNN